MVHVIFAKCIQITTINTSDFLCPFSHKSQRKTRRPRSGAQSGSRIYQFVGRGGWGGGSWNLMLSSNLLKSKIPICGRGGGFVEFDAEFKFAKIQNSHLWGWGGVGGSWKLMLSSNLLKSKIPICGGGVGWGVHGI